MGGKVCLRCKDKALLGIVNKLLKTKSLLTSPTNVFPLHLKYLNFPANFEFSLKVKVMGSNLGYLLKSFLLYQQRVGTILENKCWWQMLFSLHQIIWKKMFFWTIKLIFVRILQSSIFGGYFDSFGKERWRKTMIENKNAQPAIQTLNLLFISTCDNKPPARTFSHNYVVCTTESKSGPQLLSFFLLFAD